MTKNLKPVHKILLFSLLVRIFLFFKYDYIFWDAAVYLGMAKNFLGISNYWEIVRPIGMPLLLSMFGFLKLNMVILGRISAIFFSLGSIFLTYKFAEKLYSKKIANIASIILSFNILYLYWGTQFYTTIPATFFALLSYYYFFNNKMYLSGFFISLTFLMRFPLSLFIIPLELIIILKKNEDHYFNLYKLNTPFIITLIAFGLFNYFRYQNPLTPVIIGLHSTNWTAAPFFFTQNNFIYILTILAFFSITINYKKPTKEQFLYFFLPSLIIFAFFQLISMKEERYLMAIFPFLSIIFASGIAKFKKTIIYTILTIYIIITCVFFIIYPVNTFTNSFYSLPYCNQSDLVATSNPLSLLYYDNIQMNFNPETVNTTCVFWSNCDWGSEFNLNDNYKLVYNTSHYVCNYYIYKLI